MPKLKSLKFRNKEWIQAVEETKQELESIKSLKILGISIEEICGS